MDIFTTYATDASLENNGTWIKVGDARFKIARAGNRKFQKALAAAYETHRPALTVNDDAADALSDQIMAEVMAKTILLDWEHVEFRGQPMHYSTGNAKAALAIKDFRKLITNLAGDIEHFRVKEEEAQGKA